MKTILFQARISETETEILRTLGHGSKADGFRLALTWASHFYNMGLRDDQNLDFIGLAVRVNPELTINWQDYKALENAHRTDLNALQDDFAGSDDSVEG